MTGIAENYQDILRRIRNAASRAGRSPESIRLIAVSKTVPADRIKEAVACGVTDIGENRLQEALLKREELSSVPLRWHYIGHLQTNKAKKVAETFDWVHSVDRLAVGEALEKHLSERRRMPVLIEVKMGNEPNKSGAEESELPALVQAISQLKSLELRGLMAVPPPVEDPEQARSYFRRLKDLAREFGLPELSMGMTHDFEVAVEEGATMVRIGTGLFGARS
jgi:pyridoxal phosphate enzyme (YggS family)